MSKKVIHIYIILMVTGKELRKALKVNEISMEVAAEKLGMSRQNLYYLTNKAEIDDELITNVKTKLGIDLSAPPVPFVEQRRNQKLTDDPYLVPFVDLPAQAGYTKAYQQRDYIASLKKYPILPDVDPTGAVWRYFQIEGDSMEPEIMGGDIILCSQVHIEDWKNITDFHTHVIVTDENLWIKDVLKHSKTEWILLSQNENYNPFLVKVEEVKQVWVLRRHIKARAKKARMYNIDEIKKQLDSSQLKQSSVVNPYPFEEFRIGLKNK